jgi:hypothetical protein
VHFENGDMLYMHSFAVRTDDRVWALAGALRDRVRESRTASAAVTLERVGRGREWRLVSFELQR